MVGRISARGENVLKWIGPNDVHVDIPTFIRSIRVSTSWDMGIETSTNADTSLRNEERAKREISLVVIYGFPSSCISTAAP